MPTPVEITPQVRIPGLPEKLTLCTPSGDSLVCDGIAQYIGAAYNWLIVAATIFCVVMIMIGGLQYLTAGGGGKVQDAQKRIKDALFGLVLLLSSYLILYLINPAFVNLPALKLDTVENIPVEIGGGASEGVGSGGISYNGNPSGEIPVAAGKFSPYAGDSGCDISAAQNTPIKSVTDGIVRYTDCATCVNGKPTSGTHSPRWDCEGVTNGRGDCAVSIQLSTDERYVSYLHMSNYNSNIRPGQSVKRGDVLGFVGTANHSPHVHVEFGKSKSTVACDLIKRYNGQ